MSSPDPGVDADDEEDEDEDDDDDEDDEGLTIMSPRSRFGKKNKIDEAMHMCHMLCSTQ